MATTTDDTSRTARLLALMKQGDDAFNSRDFAAMDAVHHADMIAHITGSAEPVYGRAAHAAMMERMFRIFPDVRVHNDPYPVQFGSGDWITVVTRVTGAGGRAHTAGARSAYLRAASYYDLCLYFILGTSARAREADAYAAMQRCWQQASQLFDPPFEPVCIPYGSGWLPGYLLRPDTRTVRRPTVILNNGEDAQNDRPYAYGGAAALERG